MTPAILADLDDTLFDDRHAMSCAISALHASHAVGGAITVHALGMVTFHVCNPTPGRTMADAADAAASFVLRWGGSPAH